MTEQAVIRIDRRANPFDELADDEKMRLIVRVLCELVAYGEAVDDVDHPAERLAS
ncbi:MAG: hypothetical protein JJU45_10530 [Acidimicrobiia bacterium]|nr:hypothetical protein [Acidimicrobiia bacterium]